VILVLLSTANSYTCEHIYIKASEQLFSDAIKTQDFEVFIAFTAKDINTFKSRLDA